MSKRVYLRVWAYYDPVESPSDAKSILRYLRRKGIIVTASKYQPINEQLHIRAKVPARSIYSPIPDSKLNAKIGPMHPLKEWGLA